MELFSNTKVCVIVCIVITILASANSQQVLVFESNVGEERYRFQYNETFTNSEGVLISLPPDLFRVNCTLDGQSSTNIAYNNTGGDGGTFIVHPTTGGLSLRDPVGLDFETRRRYLFGVSCTHPSAAIDANAQVDFEVLPVNEFAPFVRTIFRLLSVFEFETATVGTILVSTRSDVGAQRVFSATDMDGGEDGELRYTLRFNENLTSLVVDEFDGTISISQSIDVDNIPGGFFTREIRLTVCDIKPPVETCPNVVINLVIFPSNDNNPVFSQNVYRVSILESAPPGSVVTVVSCTDADVGSGQFSNVISSSSLFNVTLENQEQIISLDSVLDFEISRTHNITLTCNDTGGISTTASLIVTVEPVNDMPPVFSQNQYFFTMNRIETLGNVIGKVAASDGDDKVGNQLTYTLTETVNFEMQGDGSIILKDFVYIIEGQIFLLTATVSDGNFTDSATVEVTVNGLLSVPEIILICMGAIIFLVLVVFFIVCSCYCCVCCTRLLPKQRHVDVIKNENAVGLMDPIAIAMPMTVMGGDMFNSGKSPMYSLGNVAAIQGNWGSQSMEEEEETENDEMVSIVTASSRVYTPTPYLKEMVEMFQEGDEILQNKKAKRKE